MKAALVMLALAACEHAEPVDKKKPPPPPPDPIHELRDAFELLPPETETYGVADYGYAELHPDAPLEEQYDEGAFIGRLRAVWGPRDGNDYALRHKATGFTIEAFSGKGGPRFAAGPGSHTPGRDNAAIQARIAADPVLDRSTNPGGDIRALMIYSRHMADAQAGPELAGVVAHLDALLGQVRPADWQETVYFEDGPGVYTIGAKGGRSFNEELPAAESFEFLAKDAESRDPKERDAIGGRPFDADSAMLEFYVLHQDELADQRPRALGAYQRLLAEAKTYKTNVQSALLDEARELAGKLHLPPP